jgi:pterin-4a-carbinolamine dehydratase
MYKMLFPKSNPVDLRAWRVSPGNKKIPIDISVAVFYQAIAVVNIVLWGSESWALKEANRSKLEAFHHDMGVVSPQDVRVDGVGSCSRETDQEQTS